MGEGVVVRSDAAWLGAYKLVSGVSVYLMELARLVPLQQLTIAEAGKRPRQAVQLIYFGLSENFGKILVRNFLSKSKKNAGRKTHFAKFRGKVETLSTHPICRKFASVCRNSVGNLKCLSENCNFIRRLFLDTYDSAGIRLKMNYELTFFIKFKLILNLPLMPLFKHTTKRIILHCKRDCSDRYSIRTWYYHTM